MRTAICVIIKNENDYLDEWINYHLNLGINEIFLYEDYGSKSHLDIITPYEDRVHLNPIDVIYNCSNDDIEKHSFKQTQLFEYFSKIYKNDFDWILFIDIDEFLVLSQPLHELLTEYSDKTAIFLKWMVYGASGHLNKPVGKVMDNYTDFVVATFDYNFQFKSFINCKKNIKWINNHEVKDGVYPTDECGIHKAYIKHYFTKSWEEWKTKILDRGDLSTGHRKLMQFFILNPDMISYSKNLLLDIAIDKFGIDKNKFPNENDLLLEIAINKATQLGFNKNRDKGTKYFHCCCFGGKTINRINESWKKYISDDFIVCLWDEYTFDCFGHYFVKDAYENKNWDCVIDYVCLWVMYNFGGVYFDIDIELLKPIDNLPTNFLSIERDSYKLNLGNGFGVDKENEFIGDILKIYDRKMKLIKNMRNAIKSPTIITTYFFNKGFDINKNEIHEFLGFTIYPYKIISQKI